MQVNTLSAPSAPATFRTVQPLVRIWQVGQVLDALVVARQSGTQVQLRIGTTEVQAETPLSVSPGDRLRLEVVSNDGPVVLRLVNESPREAVVAAAMRSALPWQGPLSPLLANLAVLSQNSEPLLPAELVQLGQQLFNRLATAETLAGADGLRQAWLDSGLFLEAKLGQQALSNGELNFAGDLKAGLLRLLHALKSYASATPVNPNAWPEPRQSVPRADAPPPLQNTLPQGQGAAAASLLGAISGAQAVADLSQQTEAALARLQVAQLASLPPDGEAETCWIVELPVREGHRATVLQLRIERDGRPAETYIEAPWSIWLAFDLDPLGPVRSHITLRGDAVAAAFWAERES